LGKISKTLVLIQKKLKTFFFYDQKKLSQQFTRSKTFANQVKH
jgi:hypothetical protein